MLHARILHMAAELCAQAATATAATAAAATSPCGLVLIIAGGMFSSVPVVQSVINAHHYMRPAGEWRRKVCQDGSVCGRTAVHSSVEVTSVLRQYSHAQRLEQQHTWNYVLPCWGSASC